MRAHLPSYEMKVARTLTEALELLAEKAGEWRPFAGGTDLMVLFESGKLAHKKFVSIWGLTELQGITVYPDRVELGALVTYSQLQSEPVLQIEFPNLVHSSSETGAIAIQNRGTLGGNIANASPAADASPSLLAYEAEIELVSKRGVRRLKYSGFHQGYKKTALAQDELISRLILPRVKTKRTHYFRKVGTRKAQAISKLCVAGVREENGQLRTGWGSVGAVPLLFDLPGGMSIAQARDELARRIAPIDDIRSTREYRLEVSLNLLEDLMKETSRN